MKKMNKKGFTLIELLAVIVILAIIMVIAVPQILNVIDKSRESAWNSNVKMIEEAIETNEALITTNMTTENGAVSVLSEEGCKSANITKMADIDTTATTIADGTYVAATGCKFKVSPTANGNFKNQAAQDITCTASGCSHTASATE